MSRMKMEDLRMSDSVRRLNPELAGKAPAQAARPVLVEAQKEDCGRNHMRMRAMNMTEGMFYAWLLSRKPDAKVIPQPRMLFPLAGGGTYTPDFLEITDTGVNVWEVKGGYKGPGAEQGYDRYKRAALEWADRKIRFAMATYDRKKGTWTIEHWGGRGDD